jgi:phosphate-selective porin OprO/OprP
MLKNSAKADEEQQQTDQKELTDKVEEMTSSLPVVTMKGKFKLESQDGQHSFQSIGRVFWDTIWADDDGSTAVTDGSELRRARLGFQAQFFNNWQAKLEYDFAGSDADLKDGWISYNNGFSNGDKYNIKVGQHHVPFGFNTISSSKYMSFLRRPLFADGPLSPARQYGAAFRVDGSRYLVHAGVFLEAPGDGETNTSNIVDSTDDDQRTFAVRVAGTPFMQDEKHLIHIGGSYMHIDVQDNAFRVRQRAITHLDSIRMFDTGTFAAGVIDSVNAYDLESLAIFGPFHALGEYVHWDLDNSGTGADTLSAWSFEAGYFFTGESMKYKKGQFSGVSPNSPFINGGIGAWQAIARYENMDLNDGTTVGGDGDVLSLGVNWTPIKNVRLMATYNKLVDFSRAANVNDGTEPSAFSLRTMVYW